MGLLSLLPIEPPEPIPDWGEICKSPAEFKAWLAANFLIKFSGNFDNVVVDENKPEPKDRAKFWVKTSWPYGMGSVADGEWQMDYGMSGYPVKIPFLHADTVAREYLRKLDGGELKKYGITDTDSGPDATARMFWYMFEPPTIPL